MNAVLERNVEQLLTRSWKRARPSPGFEEALLADLLARVEPARAPEPRLSRRILLVAAALIVVFGAGWLLNTRSFERRGEHAPSLAELQADGQVAWRDGAEADWRALAPSAEEIDWTSRETGEGSTYLEVATPARRGVHVRLARGLVTMEPLTHARFDEPGSATRRVRLDRGALLARLDEAADRVLIDTSEGATNLRHGVVAVGILRASETSVKLAEVDPAREVVRLELTRDAAATVSGVAGELPTEVPLFLQNGRLLSAVATPAAGGTGAGRELLTAPEELIEVAQDEPAPGLPSIVGNISTAGEAAPAEVVVWTLHEVPLPKVSTPVMYVFPTAEGRFSIQPDDAGRYRVFVEAPGRAIWKGEAQIETGGADVILDVTLSAGGVARGFVVDAETGAPIAGALVLAEHDLPHQVIDTVGVELESFERMPRAHAVTGPGGEFELADLSLRSHVLRVSREGYAPSWSVDFEVQAAGEFGDGIRDLGAIELGHGGRVEGRVERADGSAWEGAEVIVSRIEMQRNLSLMTFGGATTGPDGNFAIEELPEGFYVALNLGEQPNEEEGWSQVKQIGVQRGATTRVDFLGAVGRTRLFGIVRDGAGEPVLDCSVGIAPALAKGWSNWTVAPVRAEGRYSFDDLAPGRYGLFVNRNFETMTLVRAVDVPENASVAADLVLPPGEISGVVRDSQGAPLSDVLLLLQRYDDEEGDWDFAGKGGVDSAGRYHFAGLHPGRYAMSVLGQRATLGALISEDLSITSTPLTKDFELRAGGRVVVRVKDLAGAPVVGARVRLSQGGRECPYHPEPFTDSNGERVVLSLSAGRWTIAVEVPGHQRIERELLVLAGESNELDIVTEER